MGCRLTCIAVPRVRKIVYSTCSIHAVENEHVACEALKSEEASKRNFKLAPHGEVLPDWHRRGLADESDSPGENGKPTLCYLTFGSTEYALSFVRCSPSEDATNGFFVSCFVSRDEAQAAHCSDNFMAKKRKGDEKSSMKKRRKLD